MVVKHKEMKMISNEIKRCIIVMSVLSNRRNYYWSTAVHKLERKQNGNYD